MTQIAVQIPDDLKPFIDRSVKAGLFGDAADFVVNLLYHAKAESEVELSEEQRLKLAALRKEIAVGIDQAERGEFVEFSAEEIIAEGRSRLAASNR